MNGNQLPLLPPDVDVETKAVLKQLARANRALAELKGYADTIPNKHILINAVMINEAKDSSAIENIITTHDDLYKAMSDANGASAAAKEVVSYRTALWFGYEQVKAREMLTTNMMIEIQGHIEKNRAGIRKLPGTVLRNERTGETVYTPPAGEDTIRTLLANLETYINDDIDDIDPLIKLAMIHYQFESIHPFYDGNGRTGRIINVLYLVLKGLLDSPILYLSRYIIRNKSAYYQLLQSVRTESNWEPWIIYILTGIEETAEETLQLVKRINAEVEAMSAEIKDKLPKIYSKELIELLFYEFYTKITYIEKGLSVSRKTAINYLNVLEKEGFLISEKIGKERIYQNKRLYDLVK
ncbi:Fic family protein [Heliophilum fasciatum]|uniref:Fic family protein n=1 Tax=Heliophilum fasciatum TaxID=35700 RepID=A0A4R2RML4_9FIRM|nr:Fic/DOC family N-terminal domain-containing protein [Heliophilum fasciatum]MCW2278118.1 Fic family protein [Heliophilum fasciatum]TCP64188.1 Fic family protein [Heliophilum fasciatum]